MKVVFKAAAVGDIEAIGDFVAQHNPERSIPLVEEIRLHANKIGDSPELYAVESRFSGRHIRRCVYGNYLIFYRIARSRVEIL